MKKSNILNPALTAAAASLGHTEYLVIADCGLPIPEGPARIDLSVAAGVPSFLQVLEAVEGELVVQSYIYAAEMEGRNEPVLAGMRRILGDRPAESVSHEEFKKLTRNARYIVRTGETTSYANVILVGGVNF